MWLFKLQPPKLCKTRISIFHVADPMCGHQSKGNYFLQLAAGPGVKDHQFAHAQKTFSDDISIPATFVFKSSKLSIRRLLYPLSIHGLKSLLFAGEAWNLMVSEFLAVPIKFQASPANRRLLRL